MTRFLIFRPSCHILFTTRRHSFGGFPDPRIDVLPQRPGLQLLLHHRRRHPALDAHHPEHADAVAIYRILGGLPLALDIAAAHIGRRLDATLAAYRQELLARGALDVVDDRKGRLDANALYTRHTAAVTATLAEQWQGLAHENARLLLQVAALLPEASIIAHGWRCWRATGQRAASLAQAGSRRWTSLSMLRCSNACAGMCATAPAGRPRLQQSRRPNTSAPHSVGATLAGCWSPTMTLPCCKVSAPHTGSPVEQDLLVGLDLLADAAPGDRLLSAGSMLLRALRQESHTLRARQTQDDPVRFCQQWLNAPCCCAMRGWRRLRAPCCTPCRVHIWR